MKKEILAKVLFRHSRGSNRESIFFEKQKLLDTRFHGYDGTSQSAKTFTRASEASGFTLLEIIIALTILTMVIMIIGNGYRLGMNAWEKGENETLWTQRFRVLSGLLSQQIKSAYPYMMELDDEKVVAFQGKADSIIFVTALTDSSYGGFKWIRYSHKDRTLFLKEGLLPDKELVKKISGNEEIVDTDIEEIKFAFYSPEEGDWKDSWDYGKRLPGAVRVKISYFEPFMINIPMGLAKEEEKSAT